MTREAGVTPTVLYTYFEDMGELRNRLGDSFLGGLDLSLLRNGTPPEGLRTFVRHVLDTFNESPEHAALLAAQRIAGVHALTLNEALLNFFIDAVGHPPPIAAGMTTFLTEWVHGRVLLSPSNPATDGFTHALSRLDTADFPRTMAMLSTPGDESGVVDFVLEAITTGPD